MSNLFHEPTDEVERPSAQERPPERDAIFWANITRAGGGALLSPAFDNETAVWDWIDETARSGDTVFAARRALPSGHDYPLEPPAEQPDHARLNELIGRAHAALTEGAERARATTARRDRGTDPSTAVTESPQERAAVMRQAQATRDARAAEHGGTGTDPLVPMLRYGEVYGPDGRPTADALDAVNHMRAGLGMPAVEASSSRQEPVESEPASAASEPER